MGREPVESAAVAECVVLVLVGILGSARTTSDNARRHLVSNPAEKDVRNALADSGGDQRCP